MSLPPVVSISPPVCLVKACIRASTRGLVGRVIDKTERAADDTLRNAAVNSAVINIFFGSQDHMSHSKSWLS